MHKDLILTYAANYTRMLNTVADLCHIFFQLRVIVFSFTIKFYNFSDGFNIMSLDSILL